VFWTVLQAAEPGGLFSLSCTREKVPIYTMGSSDPLVYSRNKRGIDGSSVLITGGQLQNPSPADATDLVHLYANGTLMFAHNTSHYSTPVTHGNPAALFGCSNLTMAVRTR